MRAFFYLIRTRGGPDKAKVETRIANFIIQ